MLLADFHHDDSLIFVSNHLQWNGFIHIILDRSQVVSVNVTLSHNYYITLLHVACSKVPHWIHIYMFWFRHIINDRPMQMFVKMGFMNCDELDYSFYNTDSSV